jgi:transcriptional regulator with XRE-family HTH domain
MPDRPAATPQTRRQAQVRFVGAMIRAGRKAAGLSQAGLAYRMTAGGYPTSRGAISNWETQRIPGADAFIAIVFACASAMPASRHDRDFQDLLDAFAQLFGPEGPGRR